MLDRFTERLGNPYGVDIWTQAFKTDWPKIKAFVMWMVGFYGLR